MNTYVFVQVRKDYIVDTKVTRRESLREALIDFDFYPADPWEDLTAEMLELGLLSDARCEELSQISRDSGIPYPRELKEEVADYAVERWGRRELCRDGDLGEYYILEIPPDGAVISHPKESNIMVVD